MRKSLLCYFAKGFVTQLSNKLVANFFLRHTFKKSPRFYPISVLAPPTSVGWPVYRNSTNHCFWDRSTGFYTANQRTTNLREYRNRLTGLRFSCPFFKEKYNLFWKMKKEQSIVVHDCFVFHFSKQITLFLDKSFRIITHQKSYQDYIRE